MLADPFKNTAFFKLELTTPWTNGQRKLPGQYDMEDTKQ